MSVSLTEVNDEPLGHEGGSDLFPLARDFCALCRISPPATSEDGQRVVVAAEAGSDVILAAGLSDEALDFSTTPRIYCMTCGPCTPCISGDENRADPRENP